jgi:hypothetical protein
LWGGHLARPNYASYMWNSLVEKLHPKNGSKLLSLAVIVKNAPKDASVNENY